MELSANEIEQILINDCNLFPTIDKTIEDELYKYFMENTERSLTNNNMDYEKQCCKMCKHYKQRAKNNGSCQKNFIVISKNNIFHYPIERYVTVNKRNWCKDYEK